MAKEGGDGGGGGGGGDGKKGQRSKDTWTEGPRCRDMYRVFFSREGKWDALAFF